MHFADDREKSRRSGGVTDVVQTREVSREQDPTGSGQTRTTEQGQEADCSARGKNVNMMSWRHMTDGTFGFPV